MSVVLATICTDGLVIAADREISGSGFKYYEPKVEKVQLLDTDLVLGYAGLPDRMKAISEELRKRLEPDHSHDEIEVHLQLTLDKIVPRNEKYPHQMLCGFNNGSELRLLKTWNRDVYPVPVWDCIGIADTSLIRYLGAIFLEARIHLSLYRAVPICNYIVAQAKKYVEGCGGLTDLSVMTPDGKTQEQWSSAFTDNLCDLVETALNGILTASTEPDVTPERLESLIQSLRNVLNTSTKPFHTFLS